MAKTLLIFLIYLSLENSLCQEAVSDPDDFETLRLHQNLFVDKTSFIHELLESKQPSLLIVRPSGWGKSIIMDMLRRFFQPEIDSKGDTLIKEKSTNGKLFLGGSIHLNSSEPKHLHRLKISEIASATQKMGKHPVIFLKMKNTFGNTSEEIADQIMARVKEAFEQHQYLLHSNRITLADELIKYFAAFAASKMPDLQNSIYFLSWKLSEHFGQGVIILIDDYDAPIINAYLRFGAKSQDFKKILELVKNLYRTALSFNTNLFKSVLFGSLKISLTNDTSSMASSMLDISTLANPRFSDYFAFNNTEILTLLTQVPSQDPFDLKQMRLWYGDYFSETGDVIYYNSRSIIKYLTSNGTLQYYGLDSNKSTGLADKLLSSDVLLPKIHELLSDIGMEFVNFPYASPINWDRISILEILYLNGYFRSRKVPFQKNQRRLIIANKEMKFFFATKVLQWVTDKLGVDDAEFCSLAEALRATDISGFEKKLQGFLANAASYIGKLDNEGKVFVVGLMVALQRAIAYSHFTLLNDSEGEFSTDEDILLIPKLDRSDVAIAINYKRVVKTLDLMAKASIEEIRGCRYEEKFKTKSRSHVKKMIKIGIAFCGDTVLVKHEIGNVTDHL